MNVLVSFLSGAVAGLALAAPLGAVGVLLVQEGITRGLRRGLPSAAAVATVDILYCTAAVTAGALAGPIVSGWTPWPQILGGLALIAIGVHGLLRIWRSQIRVIDPRVLGSGASHRRFILFPALDGSHRKRPGRADRRRTPRLRTVTLWSKLRLGRRRGAA